MTRKRHKPEEIVAKLRQVNVLVSQGQSVADAIRSIGVTEVTYYRWRQEFGGLKSDQVKRLKELETENLRLRKAVADLTLDKLIPRGGCRGKLVSPARRRLCIEHVRRRFAVSERRVCAAPSCSNSCNIVRRSARRRGAVMTRRGSRPTSLNWHAATAATGTGGSPPCCGQRGGWSTTSGWSGSGAARD